MEEAVLGAGIVLTNSTKIIDIWDKSVFETPKYVYAKFNNLIFLVISDSTNILYLEKYDTDFNNVFCISPTISISFCILFFSTSSFAIFALRIAKAAGADKVSNNFT